MTYNLLSVTKMGVYDIFGHYLPPSVYDSNEHKFLIRV